ncbi:ErpA protein (erpA) (plasmid) [Borrelia coriaceae ATCC 43381]|uniref:ErpA protein (ErpA) n=1 Tax=Borrelia coriaceae ATCC 43381 TaxID=1408429 RepID=W5T2S7_9SPIR|nr:ErpA protein (erpA) [Borrelia coriaceae ATCC 43381]
MHKKCKFKPNVFFSILNLKLSKNDTIKVCKMVKRMENSIKSSQEKANTIKPTMSHIKSKKRN